DVHGVPRGHCTDLLETAPGLHARVRGPCRKLMRKEQPPRIIHVTNITPLNNTGLPMPMASDVLRHLTRDAWLLFATRFIRLFAYGSLSVVLVLYLISLGLTESQIGLLLTLTLAGDMLVSLY